MGESLIKEIALEDLREFGGSYGVNFYSTNSDTLKELKQSIKDGGLINPIIVREDPLGKSIYEIISGHTRVKAYEELGLKKIKAEIRTLSDKEALYIYCESNRQRCGKTIMEKAYSEFYRKRFLNGKLEQEEINLSSLVNLNKNIQVLVDHKKIKLEVALDIVGLSEKAQDCIANVLMGKEKILTKEMVRELKKIEGEKRDNITLQIVDDIINKSQRNIAFKHIKVNKKIFNMFPTGMSHKEKVAVVEELLEKAMKEKYENK